MHRSFFSAALIVLLAVALAWGNCARCTDFVPAQTESHDCCDKDQKPAPMDCAGKMVDFAKASQPENSKAPLVLVNAGAIVANVHLIAAQSDSAAAVPPVVLNGSRLAAPLRI
ncbi:MAG TPA: hypothetical protein VFL57_17090 [Bryobacteraceae bacterium]|nr:hypothetical protein [Bryobacteraceae bacterium]